MIWTADLIAQLRQLYDEGLPYSEIAYRFRRQGHNVSKNAMVGKGRRIGLPPRKDVTVLTPAQKYRRLLVRRAKDAQHKRERRRMTNEDDRVPRGSTTTTPEAIGRKAARSGLLIDLDMDQCRWPVQTISHATYLFCCEDAWPGKSYCPDHCNKSYGPNWIR